MQYYMVITQFRKFTPLNIVWVSLVGLLLCMGIFPSLPETLDTQLVEPALLSSIGEPPVLRIPSLANVLITLAITVVQALYLNRVINKYNFFPRPGFLVALMYMTLASLLIPFLVLSPILICNFIFIWMLDKLLGIYHRQAILKDMFDLGLIVAMGSLVYFPFMSMLLTVWIGLSLFRPFQWREWVAPLMGFLTVYFLLWVVYFWNGREEVYWALWRDLSSPVFSLSGMDPYDYLIWLPVVLILILFMLTLQRNFFRRVVHIRKTIQLLFVALLTGLGSLLLDPAPETAHLLVLVPPLSIYTAYYFNFAEKKWLYEGVYLLLVLVIVLFQLL